MTLPIGPFAVFIAAAAFVASLVRAHPLLAQAPTQVPTPAATSEVFRRFADRVVKIEVLERGSAAKAELGSGFYANAEGLVVTNFHVISRLVHDPARYRAELSDPSGRTAPVTVVAVDVVHDLAVLRTPVRPALFFSLGTTPVAQGSRLYALGHPHDLGLSVVEGTYNGLLQHTLYAKIHFTGSLNPGMSGGPALTADGNVVGVNVSTQGNQVSFLVPAARVIELLARVAAPAYRPPAQPLADVGRQLTAYQREYLAGMFEGTVSTVALGPFRVPTRPAPFFKCWADATEADRTDPYRTATYQCSTDDYVFVSEEMNTGIVELSHELLTTSELDRFRFYSLYERHFSPGFATGDMPYGDRDEVTPYRCETRNVGTGRTQMRAALCVRRYRKLGELYDAVLTAAVLGANDAGLVTTLRMSGVTIDNVQRLSRRYLESITWRE